MILPFSTHWPAKMGELAGEPNCFISKIWMGLDMPDKKDIHEQYATVHVAKIGKHWDVPDSPIRPKIHTLRHDLHNRWQPGKDIHFTINNRTKNSFRFAPVVKCTAVQYLDIARDGEIIQVYISSKEDRSDMATFYYQDWKVTLSKTKMLELAQNDGFDSIDDFFSYFNESCQLKLIHWTDKRY